MENFVLFPIFLRESNELTRLAIKNKRFFVVEKSLLSLSRPR